MVGGNTAELRARTSCGPRSISRPRVLLLAGSVATNSFPRRRNAHGALADASSVSPRGKRGLKRLRARHDRFARLRLTRKNMTRVRYLLALLVAAFLLGACSETTGGSDPPVFEPKPTAVGSPTG